MVSLQRPYFYNAGHKSTTTTTMTMAPVARSSSYKVSGELHSWKSGDIKLLLKSEETGTGTGSSPERPTSRIGPRSEPISKVFDEKIPNFESEKSPNVVDRSSSLMPASSQLVKNVDASFKTGNDVDVDGREKIEKPRMVRFFSHC